LQSLEVSIVNSLDKCGLDRVVKARLVVIHQLAHVGTLVDTVGQGCVRFGSLDRYAIGKLSGGSGCEGGDGLGLVVDSKLSHPAVADNLDLPKAIVGVTPPLQDGLAIECDFATCFLKKYLATHVA
jgi:hypothetical protein